MTELYLRADCPFCTKVKKAVEAMGLVEGREYTIIDAAPGTPGREEVLRVGGRAMVPFLIDGDHAMYESDDIIAWMRAKYQQE